MNEANVDVNLPSTMTTGQMPTLLSLPAMAILMPILIACDDRTNLTLLYSISSSGQMALLLLNSARNGTQFVSV